MCDLITARFYRLHGLRTKYFEPLIFFCSINIMYKYPRVKFFCINFLHGLLLSSSSNPYGKFNASMNTEKFLDTLKEMCLNNPKLLQSRLFIVLIYFVYFVFIYTLLVNFYPVNCTRIKTVIFLIIKKANLS